MPEAIIDGTARPFTQGEPLLAVINRGGTPLPQVCYHPQLGAIQTCDTCMVEVDGKLVRACGTPAVDGMKVATASARAQKAQREAFDRILGNHLLYCTVCDNNNGNCTVHNTTKMLQVEHQETPFRPKPYAVDNSNPFYRYDPDQCILCGRCVEACQNVQVNETLSIRWEDEHPRVLWDGGAPIGESSCVSCGHCVTVCPCNALMEKSMLGAGGVFHRTAEAGVPGNDRCSEGHGGGGGVRGDSAAVGGGSGDAGVADEEDEDGVHLLRGRVQLRRVDAGPAHLKGGAGTWSGERDFDRA